jgi:hypothetical protein
MVVLKSKLSGYYFADFGIWTPHVLQAATFVNEWDARGFAQREHLHDVVPIDANSLADIQQAA